MEYKYDTGKIRGRGGGLRLGLGMGKGSKGKRRGGGRDIIYTFNDFSKEIHQHSSFFLGSSFLPSFIHSFKRSNVQNKQKKLTNMYVKTKDRENDIWFKGKGKWKWKGKGKVKGIYIFFFKGGEGGKAQIYM